MADTVGELGFYRQWKASAMSRVTLDLVQVTPNPDGTENEVPVSDGPAAEAMAYLFDGDEGESQIMRAFGNHLAVPGDCWLFGVVDPDLSDLDAPDQWRVLSRAELTQTGSTWEVNRGDGNPERYAMGDPEDGEGAEAIAIRIWQPHPDRWVEADSSVRAALPILRQLQGLAELDGGAIDSRLKGAGILFVPQEMSFSTPNEQAGDPQDPRMDEFMANLTETMMKAREDRSSAAAHVPTVVKVPGQLIEKVKHITFDTPFDERSAGKVQEAIQRLATALDTPAEVLTGMTDVNHWTGWLLDENAVKLHVDPPAMLVAQAVQTRYLWPALADPLTGRIDPEVRTYQLRPNTAKLRQRQDRSANAITLHDGFVLTDAALAREAGGFDDSDILSPTSDEFRRRVLLKLATAGGAPDLVAQAAAALGVDGISTPVAVTEKVDATTPPELPAADTPNSPPEQPTTAPPAAQAPVPAAASAAELAEWRAAALILGCEANVTRAVERAWNRAGKRGRSRRPISAASLDVLLAGAWDFVPRVAAMIAVDEQRLQEVVEHYTRTLLTTGEEHSPSVFSRLLRERVLDA